MDVIAHLMAIPLTTPSFGVELASMGGELETHTGEAPFDAALLAQLQSGDLRALEKGRARLAVRLQELADSPGGGEALSRFAERVRALRETGEVPLPTRPIKELIARYIHEAELFDLFRMQIDPDEVRLLEERGWDAVWDQMSPEHFMEVWNKVMGNKLSPAISDEPDPQDRRSIGELLTLGLTAKSHNFSMRVGDLGRFEELVAKAMRIVRNQATRIGPPGPKNFEVPLIVDRYFAPRTKEREWFDVEWKNAERRHEGEDSWKRLNAVVTERLRTADQLPSFVALLYEHERDNAAAEVIRRSRLKVEGLLGLIDALKAQGHLHLSTAEWGMVEDLRYFYTAKF